MFIVLDSQNHNQPPIHNIGLCTTHKIQRLTHSFVGVCPPTHASLLTTNRYNFDTAKVALTCHDLGDCLPRFEGHAKNPGPSYPQAITLVDPAPESMRGLYVVASNNKEDIWITKIDYSSI
jgi:hypothetical protein